jgi:hypothetical protein
VLVAAACVPVPIFVAGLLLSRYRPIHTQPWLVAGAAGLGVWAVVMVAIGRVVRGRSDSLRRFLMLAMLLLFPVPMLTVTLLFNYNGGYDHSPMSEHITTVERVKFSQSKNGHRSYYVVVKGWDSGGRPVDVSVPSSVARQVQPGQSAVITTGAGRLGWEWLIDYRF